MQNGPLQQKTLLLLLGRPLGGPAVYSGPLKVELFIGKTSFFHEDLSPVRGEGGGGGCGDGEEGKELETRRVQRSN